MHLSLFHSKNANNDDNDKNNNDNNGLLMKNNKLIGSLMLDHS